MPEVRCETCRHVIPVKRYGKGPEKKSSIFIGMRYECAKTHATVEASSQCEHWKESDLPCI